jgi:ABC-type amino acid transport substrate-binding protein
MTGPFQTLKSIAALLLITFSSAVAAADNNVPSDSRLQSIASTKTIRIAYRSDARPFSFLNDKREVDGFSIDVCKFVASSIQQQLDLDALSIEWIEVTGQTRLSAVASGKADMECGATTVTLSRMKEVDFSNYVFIETTGILVKRTSDLRTFADMKGKKIAVISGTTNERALAAQIKVRKVDAILVSVKSRDEGVSKLEGGGVDGFASDKLLLIGSNMNVPESLVMLPDDLSVEPYAIVLPRGDWAFKLAVNTGLAKIFRNGQIATVVDKWFDRIGLRTGPVLRIMYGLGALSD